MNKETTRQANFRLPETLLDDLKKVAEVDPDKSQTTIVKTAIERDVKRLQKKLGITKEAVMSND